MRKRFARLRRVLTGGGGWALAAGFTAVAVGATLLAPRIAQPESYHDFADKRRLLGIPNALNVLSNLPFLVVGMWGLYWLWRSAQSNARALSETSASPRFADAHERYPLGVVFAGLALTAFGSGYYHLAPNDQRLLWDRLGMVVGFSALLPLAVSERVDAKLGARLLAPMVGLGAASVAYWEYSEMASNGDVRWYVLAQAYAFFMTAGVLLLTETRYDRQARWLQGIGCYALAKLFEMADRPVYWLTGHAISGHSLKHVSAALGGYYLLRMAQERKLLAEPKLVAVGSEVGRISA
jgi:hypothetical protein